MAPFPSFKPLPPRRPAPLHARVGRKWAMPAAPVAQPERVPNMIVGAWLEEEDEAPAA